MAKNLKLTVKNNQLAQALKKSKEKEGAKKKAEAPAKKTATAAKRRPAVKRATVTTKPEEKIEKPKVTPRVEEAVEKKAPERKPEPKPEYRAKETPKPKKEAEKAPPPKKEIPKKKEIKSIKETKEKGLKKLDGKRSFDSRARMGLRVDEDQGWRKSRLSRSKALSRQREKIEVVRPSSLSIRLPITLKDLAQEMKLKASEIMTKLFAQGVALTINDYLEDETLVELIGHEFNCAITIDTSEEKRLQVTDRTIAEEISEEDSKSLKPRAPIVAFMGHVDHGKTSLIDAIRKSNIASEEAGAITQHIGAFKCHREHGDITVLDTPGHEAFSLMRERGAAITDLIVIVIAGDEGMKPQTKEAIQHAKNAKLPMIIAINKSDKPDFNPDTVYRQLADIELLPEAWGGTTTTVNCSAKTGEGIPDLLEMLLLQAELLELKANPESRARGTVIESELHRGLGAIASILVQTGTLKSGDAIIIDQIYGRIKTMHDETGKSVQVAGPSTPVKITGLSGLPEAGAEFIVMPSEKEARKLCEERAKGIVHTKMRKAKPEGMESLIARQQALAEKKVLPIIIRADVQGSVEAVKNSLEKIPHDKVELNIVSADVGQISESDVELAQASGAAIIGFHTSVESHAEPFIKQQKIVVKSHDIIYHLINDVKKLMASKLDKIRQETESGTAEIKAIFKSSQLGLIAGCMVTDGTIKRHHHAKLFRGDEMIWEGEIESLKRVKEDVREVTKGHECGILLKNFRQIQEGDVIKAFEVNYIEQEL